MRFEKTSVILVPCPSVHFPANYSANFTFKVTGVQNVHQQQCIVDNDVQQIGSSVVSLMEQRSHPDRPLFTFCTVLFITCLCNRYPCW
jgi:hypothetical protein